MKIKIKANQMITILRLSVVILVFLLFLSILELVKMEKSNHIITCEEFDDSISKKILKCPQCGETKSKVFDFDYEFYVKCNNCGVRTDSYRCVNSEDSKEQAIIAWNLGLVD